MQAVIVNPKPVPNLFLSEHSKPNPTNNRVEVKKSTKTRKTRPKEVLKFNQQKTKIKKVNQKRNCQKTAEF